MRGRRGGAGQFAAAAVFILACALLPLLFVAPEQLRGEGHPRESTEPAQSADWRAQVFASYWDGDIERRRLELTAEDSEDVIACRVMAAEILSELRLDSVIPDLGDAQISYFILEDGEHRLRLMEFNQGWTGDWRNWFSIHIDLDTHEVYRAYISSQCLENFSNYSLYFPSALEIAEAWFALLGCEGGETGTDAPEPLPVDETEFSRSVETEFDVYYGDAEEELRYGVYFKCYIDNYPSMLMDLMFTMSQGG